MIKKKQIIIGTSAWGSKINFNKSIYIGEKIIKMGFSHFDTAPTYGGGISHFILNNLGKKNKIKIDTKYGQIIKPTPKEIFKRLYRFVNFKSFKESFEFVNFNSRILYKSDFWEIGNIEKYIDKFVKDLSNCDLNTFYLHSPPFKILNKTYVEKFIALLENKNITPGIAWPDNRDLKMLVNYFPKITLQLSIDNYENSKDIDFFNLKSFNLNSIFRLKTNKNKFYIEKFSSEILKFLQNQDNHKIVVGINSDKSLLKLSELVINL